MSDWTTRMQEAADAKKLVVVRPASDEVLVDIDNEASLAQFRRALPLLGDLVVGFRQAPSPSRRAGRFHITVTLSRDVKDQFERIALQALLGSDLFHEVLSWAAASRGVEHVSVFFERPSDLLAEPKPLDAGAHAEGGAP